jgi:TetR/AcrR family transcriptional regulator, regulator of cefoperazone and chloramphenicol sensitivity
MSKATRAPRTDGEATRARILVVAGELFAATGYAETTSKAIAASAGADQASINYHFGSRKGLYQAVLAEAHGRIIKLADLRRWAESELAPQAKLGALIEHLVERAQAGSKGWHLRVLARELQAPSSQLETLFHGEVEPKLAVFRRMLSEITAIPMDDPAITRCLFSVAVPMLPLLIGLRLPGPMQEIQQMPPQVLARHLHTFAVAGLAAISQEYAARG